MSDSQRNYEGDNLMTRKEKRERLIMTARSIEDKFFYGIQANWKLMPERKKSVKKRKYDGTFRLKFGSNGLPSQELSYILISPDHMVDGKWQYFDLSILHELIHWATLSMEDGDRFQAEVKRVIRALRRWSKKTGSGYWTSLAELLKLDNQKYLNKGVNEKCIEI